MSTRTNGKRHRRIAPRLMSGEKRISAGNSLPPIVKFALRVIAEQENRSLSWVVEQILIDWARDDRRLSNMLRGDAVAYRERKTPEPEAESLSVREAIRVVSRKVRAA